MIRQVLLLLLVVSTLSLKAQVRDTPSVYFLFNEWKLTDVSRMRIDKMIHGGQINGRKPVQLVGYADYVGGEDYNLGLSRKRAQSVKQYLIQSGFKESNIYIIIARGKVPREGMKNNIGYGPDRRVDIVNATPTPEVGKADTARTSSASKILSKAKDLNAIAVNQTIQLDKIFFYPGRHTVREDSKEALEHLFDIMMSNPRLKIRIEGHVCCIKAGVPDALDEDSGGFVLSTNRARAIQEWLIEKGIDPSRVKSIGFGKQFPVVAVETTEEEADKNRRVEVRILEK